MGDKKRKNAGKSETLRGKQNDRARQDKRKKKKFWLTKTIRETEYRQMGEYKSVRNYMQLL